MRLIVPLLGETLKSTPTFTASATRQRHVSPSRWSILPPTSMRITPSTPGFVWKAFLWEKMWRQLQREVLFVHLVVRKRKDRVLASAWPPP